MAQRIVERRSILQIQSLTNLSWELGGLMNPDTRTTDLAAIEELHKADVDATLTQDASALTILWSETGVNFGFPGPPVVGIKAMKEAYEKFRIDYPEFKVLKYAAEIKEVQIVDDWAIEVGEFDAVYQMSANSDPISVKDKGMRVLRRQTDGSWKFAVVNLK